jgi:UDP-galactopyranose mutase
MFDYLIVGSGFFGSICAYELNKAGYKCLVIDKRDHIGGNCYTENKDNINIHKYGAHIFHTSNDEVWKWINQFAEFNNYINSPIAIYKDKMYSLPFNMNTFNQLWGVTQPQQAKLIIEQQSKHIDEPNNLEEQAIKLVGTDVYEKLIKGYTQKQWMKDPKELPASIIKRLPVRFTYNNNYFNDKYQGIPIGGYTQIFKKLLDGIEVKLGVDYFKDELPKHKNLIYTGPIDKFYNYQFGELEYKTVEFKHQKENIDNWQGNAVVNYTDIEIDYTRILEHKHFENSDSPVTWITYEYPVEYKTDVNEPMYPVNDEINNSKYIKYKELANKEENIIFGGRLAEYKYYDMHQIIESALNKIKQLT